jgi:uncharacterized membrane protein
MLKRFSSVLVMVVMLVLTIQPSVAQSRSVFWRSWDVRIDSVDPVRNRFNVTESYDIDFSGTFRFGSAVIPPTNLESIGGIQVSQDGHVFRENCTEYPGTYCVSEGSDGTSITYYFLSEITDGQARFEIRYTVSGALRVYEGGDQLWWIAIPSDHYGFPIGSSTITVELPAGFAPRTDVDAIAAYGVPAEVTVRDTTVKAVATQQLGGSDSFEIRVQYPHNPAARKANWQDSFDQRRTFEETTKPLIDAALVALGLLISIGGVLGVYALWYTRGRDPKIGPVPTFLTAPPSDMAPALVGTLLDEQADMRDVISTIIDLARRGYLVMEETRTQDVSWLGPSSKFFFKRTDMPMTNLKSFEKRLMEALFSMGRLERTMESLRNSFYTVIPQIQNDLYEAMVAENLFSDSPAKTRNFYVRIGVALLAVAVLAGVLTFDSADTVSQSILCLPFSIGLVGFVMLFAGSAIPAKTRKGAEDAAKWNAFREYLQNLEKYNDVSAAAEHFDTYLPYAIAFGLDRSWVQRFSRLQTVPIPSWYYPTYMGGRWHRGYQAGTPVHIPMDGGMPGLPGPLAQAGGGGLNDMSRGIGGGLESISGGLTNFFNSASAAMTSVPSSQSGGSGRGFSGGGSRGGGGSGGGSRGFG